MSVEVDGGGESFRIGGETDLFQDRTAAGGTVAHDGQKFLLAKVSGDQQIAPLTLVVNWTEDLEEP